MDTQQVTNNVSTEQVANQYVNWSREGKNFDIIDQLYADNIVSTEMPNWPGQTVTEGIKSVMEKNENWMANVQEFHGGTVSDPIIAGRHFTVRLDFDVTFKDSGRQQMEEVAVFEVKDGKIVNEQFFYDM
jgi:limonene-1,2-epoxide hydrolase